MKILKIEEGYVVNGWGEKRIRGYDTFLKI